MPETLAAACGSACLTRSTTWSYVLAKSAESAVKPLKSAGSEGKGIDIERGLIEQGEHAPPRCRRHETEHGHDRVVLEAPSQLDSLQAVETKRDRLRRQRGQAAQVEKPDCNRPETVLILEESLSHRMRGGCSCFPSSVASTDSGFWAITRSVPSDHQPGPCIERMKAATGFLDWLNIVEPVLGRICLGECLPPLLDLGPVSVADHDDSHGILDVLTPCGEQEPMPRDIFYSLDDLAAFTRLSGGSEDWYISIP